MPIIELSAGPCEYVLYNAEAALEPIVLLHEGLGCIARWRRFPALLASLSGHPILIYNRIGYGRNTRRPSPKEPRYMHHEGEVILGELLRVLSWQRPWLIGHSDGASIAIIHAGAPDIDIAGLVLIAPHLFVEQRTLDGIAELKRRFVSGKLSQQLSLFHEYPNEVFLSWSDIWTSEAFARWNICDIAARIRVPTLLIQGKEDEFGTLSHIECYAALHPERAEICVLDGMGHSPHLDDSLGIATRITNFLNSQAFFEKVR